MPYQSRISLYAFTRAVKSQLTSSWLRKNSKNFVKKKMTCSVPNSFRDTFLWFTKSRFPRKSDLLTKKVNHFLDSKQVSFRYKNLYVKLNILDFLWKAHSMACWNAVGHKWANIFIMQTSLSFYSNCSWLVTLGLRLSDSKAINNFYSLICFESKKMDFCFNFGRFLWNCTLHL